MVEVSSGMYMISVSTDSESGEGVRKLVVLLWHTLRLVGSAELVREMVTLLWHSVRLVASAAPGAELGEDVRGVLFSPCNSRVLLSPSTCSLPPVEHEAVRRAAQRSDARHGRWPDVLTVSLEGVAVVCMLNPAHLLFAAVCSFTSACDSADSVHADSSR